MVAKAKGEGVAGLLKELGIPTADTLKENLTKYREYLESQKTETQKATDKANAESQARTAAETARDEAKLEVAALRLGVKHGEKEGDEGDKALQRFIKIAAGYEGTPSERAAAALKDFPEFKASGGQQVPPGAGSRIKNQGTPEAMKAAADLRAAMGLTPLKA